MSSYYDGGRARSTRDRSRRDDYEDTVYDHNSRDTRIVKRRDESVSSVEEVDRDFAPGDRSGSYYRETTVRKSGHRPVRARSNDDRYFDDRYDDRSYVSRKKRDDDYTVVSKHKSRDYDDRHRHRRRDSYSDDSSRSRSRSRTPPKKERRKSTTEELLGAVGLGGLAGTLLGKKSDKDRSRSRSSERSRRKSRSRAGSRRSSSDRSRNKSKSRGPSKAQVSQAIKAAVLAGAGEAFRARGVQGGWGGEKGKRILTAALAAGGVDGLISNSRDPDHHKKRDIVGSALAGIAANRVINGSRSKSLARDGSPDKRGRSHSRSGLGDVAAGGVVAATAKKVYDKVRSRSRGRARSRSSSFDSRGSRSPPKRTRSQSVSAFAAKGLSALGLKDAAEKIDPERRRSKQNYDDYDDGRSSRNGNGGYGYNDSGHFRR